MGMVFEVAEQEEQKVLPLETIFTGRLENISTRVMKFNDKDTKLPVEIPKMQFTFKVLSPKEHHGETARYEITHDPKKPMMPSAPLAKTIAAMLNRSDLPTGMKIDLDDIMGNQVQFTVKHREDKEGRIWVDIDMLIPLDDADYNTFDSEPPF